MTDKPFVRVWEMILLVLVLCSALPAGAGDELISVDYEDSKLTSVLKALAYSNDLNIVTAKDIDGVVSAKLDNVTVEEALRAILSVNGYTFIREGNLIFVVPGSGMESFGQQTITMRLSHLSATEAKQLMTKVISPGGDIQVNEATNSIVVTDFPKNIKNVQNVLKDVDIPPLQVLIEAKILDIQAKAFENLGTTTTITYDPKGTAGGGLFGRSNLADESLALATSLGGPSTSLSGGQLTLTTVLKSLNVSSTIDALIQENKAHLLASPSIATLNGKEARIIIGDKVPIIEKTITDTTTTESTEFVDVGTTLRVTPRVSPDGWITMNVHPEVSSVTANLAAGPNITTREADATVRVKDGQTIIIGGLISKQDDRLEGGVPVLRDIPIVRGLFSKKSKDIQEKELTVFITPYILNAEYKTAGISSGREVKTDVQRTGESNLVAKLMEHAKNLENEASVESANKSFDERREAMLNTYSMIVNQFPEAREAEFALFKSGQLFYYFKQYDQAISALEKLLARHPESYIKERAELYLQKAKEDKKKRQDVIRKELLSFENGSDHPVAH